MHINYDGLALPVSKSLADALIAIIDQDKLTGEAVTINFRDPDYSAEKGGFHPVEIRLEKRSDAWQFCYITDFCYVGSGYTAELAKDLDFDFQAGVFQNLFGVFPIEQATDMYQIWESNFLHYWQEMEVFNVVFNSAG
ncbi:DUF2787 family protein [Paraglaciecola sp. MB-3u-78]|uniref:DUF2787 family protein n=1 Tax=Paraglaciecola sp. MB-3u-78 TaxID=2058332 RepID=UPI000C326CB4|nr:DUF2787 family protein [Paraglaciecola sp. MB-3u-78]PKG93158.1 hypothetical protein CXF95_26585 [Paraglaciecola sp. MB-3u-78]